MVRRWGDGMMGYILPVVHEQYNDYYKHIGHKKRPFHVEQPYKTTPSQPVRRDKLAVYEDRLTKMNASFYKRRRHAKRSEEHTSELQSRFDLVCRLLLEKKKTLPMT